MKTIFNSYFDLILNSNTAMSKKKIKKKKKKKKPTGATLAE
jgi:hypothetical protein